MLSFFSFSSRRNWNNKYIQKGFSIQRVMPSITQPDTYFKAFIPKGGFVIFIISHLHNEASR